MLSRRFLDSGKIIALRELVPLRATGQVISTIASITVRFAVGTKGASSWKYSMLYRYSKMTKFKVFERLLSFPLYVFSFPLQTTVSVKAIS